MNSCEICEKQFTHKREVIYSNDRWMLVAVESRTALGYLHLETKRHIEQWHDLNEAEQHDFFHIVKVVESALKEIIGSERLYMTSMNELVRHLHFHLIPRLEGSAKRGLPFISEVIGGVPSVSLKEMDWVKGLKTHFVHV
ncbi:MULTISPECIES: HIT family protein [Cytobacillus]|uniref:HIT family protein n=1 Tax=Cytobacillus TaxID=2675230 RepID=UPI001CD541FB|nr:HIT domain-containing protein [Cytobacillus kochii]MCA1026849.1 HIT domain-containing protein [Cytobacillus kochii]MCM3322729.1 HIT domain-containing protein [Cytobacillus kochii]MCM3344792.1 HIT domain-containing protein [Cytobacillus kochii]MDM5209337.1 HIT domain-containing protein [Cytobacillus kochii]